MYKDQGRRTSANKFGEHSSSGMHTLGGKIVFFKVVTIPEDILESGGEIYISDRHPRNASGTDFFGSRTLSHIEVLDMYLREHDTTGDLSVGSNKVVAHRASLSFDQVATQVSGVITRHILDKAGQLEFDFGDQSVGE
jgi:hypothetical protein